MKIGIYGYGNLGEACEEAIALNPDMKLVAVFTRRDTSSITLKSKDAKVVSCYDVMNYRSRIDVMINCGGSSTDLPQSTAFLARHFNVIDAFDNHESINLHFERIDENARQSGKVALISAGWDPGVFSLMRLYFSAFLPEAKPHTFREGLGQGHSEAAKHIYGVKDIRQYSIPDEKMREKARCGQLGDDVTPFETHKSVCYVSAQPEADRHEIETQIKNLPGYFLRYDTKVNFADDEELAEKNSDMSCGGSVISNAATDINGENRASLELKMNAVSGPAFTAGVLLAYARAVFAMARRGERGCKTVLDIMPRDLSPVTDGNELRSTLI